MPNLVQGLVAEDLFSSITELWSVSMNTYARNKVYFDGLKLLFQILFNFYLLLVLYEQYQQDKRVVEINIKNKFIILGFSTLLLVYTAVLFINKHQLSEWVLNNATHSSQAST